MPELSKAESEVANLAGKYLTFMLGPETYGLDILKVQEIIGLLPITRVPKAPDSIRGVINLRGKVIPVMNLASRFGLPSREDTARTCIIVVEMERGDSSVTMGLIVDEVSEVVSIGAENIEPAPDLGASVDAAYLLGMGKIGEKVVLLLDLGCIIDVDTLARHAFADPDQ
ncbi:MAG: chemotaxis protein CheW [Candidatus Hydrogenedentota bacterium]